MTPMVSIVIPAYRAENYLAEAIDSALAQTYPHVEIIVVNDGSPDNGATRAVAKRYGSKIRYFEKENGGSSSALNYGIAQMQGEWFSWLSHDDLYEPDKIKAQIELLNTLPLDQPIDRHCFFTASALINAKGRVIRKPDPRKEQRKKEQIDTYIDNRFMVANQSAEEGFLNGCSCLIHKNALETIGGFDEKLRLVNDFDLFFRLFTSGYKIHYLPEIYVKGRVHAGQVSRAIGFSYHNAEQDRLWARSLHWLLEHYSEDTEVLHKFGQNAYAKTRNIEGDAAFQAVLLKNPALKSKLKLERHKLKTAAGLRTLAKKIYIRLVLRGGER